MPNSLKSKRTVTIIGPGRLGSALAIALSERNYKIRALVARRRATLDRAAALVDGEVLLLVAKDLRHLKPSDLTIITTPDDQLPKVVKSLSKIESGGAIVLHTSASLSSRYLEPLTQRDWHPRSIHPLVSVSEPEAAVNSFKGVF